MIDSLSIWFIPRFALVSVFTNAVIFGSNPLAFPPSGGLKPPPNPPPNPGGDNGGDSGRLLLLLFPENVLLLLFPKASNLSTGFAPIVPKCEKCSPPMFILLVALFCWLLPPAVASVIIPIAWLVKLNIFGNVVVYTGWMIVWVSCVVNTLNS